MVLGSSAFTPSEMLSGKLVDAKCHPNRTLLNLGSNVGTSWSYRFNDDD